MRLLFLLALPALALSAQNRTVLAIGAHSGDMEVSAGALLIKHVRLGDRVVLLHLTLGEAGHPKMPVAEYALQKRREAEAAARCIGAEVRFGPWKDGHLNRTEQAAGWLANEIRTIKPTHVVTHWKNSIHRDHETAYQLVNDAVLLASLPETPNPWRGVRSLWYAENWEDPEGFQPYIYVDVTGLLDDWKKCAVSYEFLRGGISAFPYLKYYESLASVRGAEARRGAALAFDVEPSGKKRVLDQLP